MIGIRYLRVVVCGLALLPRGLGSAGPSEYDVKAAYLLNVLKFAERKAVAAASDVLPLCLFAPGPIERPLAELANRLVHGRKLRVRTIGSAAELVGCEVVFVGRSSGHRAMIEKANAMGVLTVGNDGDFLRMSGMMALVIENRRVVVEINERAVNGRDWTISSHLLEVARITGGER